MTLRVKPEKVKVTDVLRALQRGGVLLPVAGSWAVVSRERDEVIKRLGQVYRLIGDVNECPVGGPAALLLNQGALVRVGGADGWARAPAGVLQEVIKKETGELWLGLSEDETAPEELIDEFGEWVTMRIDGPARGPGPTVINLDNGVPEVVHRGEPGILALEGVLGQRLFLGAGVIFSTVVVCTGNSCRSPIAAGLLQKLCTGMPVLVGSAGIAAPVGAPATNLAVAVAKEMGVDISDHRARQLDQETIARSDLVLVMEPGHREWILNRLPEAEVKVRFLGGYPDRMIEIPDPIGRSIEFYRQTAVLIKAGVLKVFAEIKERLPSKQ